jgi:protein-glutamine gamma-glutamyltransferase
VDPTSAVSPDRVQRGTRLAPRPGLVGNAIDTLNPALAQQLRNALETINNRWNQWVLNYSRGQQFDLLKRLGVRAPSWQDLATLLIVLLCGVSLAAAGWAWWDRMRQDPWQRLQRRVQARLHTLGVQVQPHHAPRARAQRVRAAMGSRGAPLAELLDALDRSRYAAAAPSHPARAWRQWWRQFQAATRALG